MKTSIATIVNNICTNLDPLARSHVTRHFSASVQGTSRQEWHQSKYVSGKKQHQGRC